MFAKKATSRSKAISGVFVLTITLDLASGCNHPATNDPSAIRHTIFIIKENRTFDTYFGGSPGADGATTGIASTGQLVDLSHMADSSTLNLCNNWNCALHAVDGGKMDRFDQPAGNLDAYSRLTEQDIPNYWAYAHRFVLADRYFSAVHGPSFPNHLFTIAAQTGGVTDNVDSSNLGRDCDGNPSGTVPVLDERGNLTRQSPCFDLQTLPDLLEGAAISWKYYAIGGGVLSTIRHIYKSSLFKERTAPPEQFEVDVVSGHLPAVSWLLPPEEMSEHPPESACQGENWTVRTVNAVMQGPDWNSTAIFIVWDDFGGLYDHVSPPQLDRMGLGPRAAMLVISPYAKSGHVSHTVYEQSSILKFVERLYNLPALTSRDHSASDMLDNFDFIQHPAPPFILSSRKCPQGLALPRDPKVYTAYDND